MYISTILLVTITTIAIIVEKTISPRIDRTKDGDLLLWYNSKVNGVKERKFIKL